MPKLNRNYCPIIRDLVWLNSERKMYVPREFITFQNIFSWKHIRKKTLIYLKMTITGIEDIIKRRPTGLSMVVSFRPESSHVHNYCYMVVGAYWTEQIIRGWWLDFGLVWDWISQLFQYFTVFWALLWVNIAFL